jgi:lipoprotein signal peptidase
LPRPVIGGPRNDDGAIANLAGGHLLTAAFCATNAVILFALSLWSTYHRRACGSWPEALSCGLLSAGMLGNAADRLALGHVREFLVAAPCRDGSSTWPTA